MNANRPTKNERRQQAREQARLLREKQIKKQKRNKLLLQSSIVVGAVAVIVAVVLVVSIAITPEGPSPANMATDGIKIGQNFEAELAPAREPSEDPLAPIEPNEDGTANIRLYVDYHCVFCQQFEQENGDQLATWLEHGAITLEIHPVSTQDGGSQGARYASRAANAAACVANYSPNNFFAFHNDLLKNRPDSRTPGYSDEEIMEFVKNSGASHLTEIEECITEESYKSWVKRASRTAIQDETLHGVNGFGTPVFTINGTRYPSEQFGNSKEAIAQFLNLSESNASSLKNSEEEPESEKESSNN